MMGLVAVKGCAQGVLNSASTEPTAFIIVIHVFLAFATDTIEIR